MRHHAYFNFTLEPGQFIQIELLYLLCLFAQVIRARPLKVSLLQLVAVFDHFEVKRVEIRLNVNALVIRLKVLVDQDKVRVDFNLSVLSDRDTDLIATDFLRDWVDPGLRDGAELQERRESLTRVRLRNHDAKLHKFDLLRRQNCFFV